MIVWYVVRSCGPGMTFMGGFLGGVRMTVHDYIYDGVGHTTVHYDCVVYSWWSCIQGMPDYDCVVCRVALRPGMTVMGGVLARVRMAVHDNIYDGVSWQSCRARLFIVVQYIVMTVCLVHEF